eukprot:gene9641-10628_t
MTEKFYCSEKRTTLNFSQVNESGTKKLATLLILLLSIIAIFCVLIHFPYNSNWKRQASTSVVEPKRHIFSQVKKAKKEEATRVLSNFVNIHFWDYTCGYEVESLRSHPLFPFFPFRRDFGSSLNVNIPGVYFGARFFGFIHVKQQSGFHQFAISSDDSSEFWLSPTEDPLAVQLLASLGGKEGKEWAFDEQFDKYESQISDKVFLKSGARYYFEVLWKQSVGRSHMRLVWKKPDSDVFVDIKADELSKYYEDELLQDGIVYGNHFKSDIEMRDLPSHITQKTKQDQAMQRDTPYQRDSVEFLLLPTIEFAFIQGVLSSCDYKPTYLLVTDNDKEVLVEGEYNGVHLPHYYNISTRIYPADGTANMSSTCIGSESLKNIHCEGNKVLNGKTAKDTAALFLDALQKKFPGKYSLHTLVNVEENSDDANGKRYLIEAALEDHELKKHVRLSVYVYRPTGQTNLCFPKGFQWNPNAMVYLILTVKDQGPWLYKYIESLSRIFYYTRDNRFTLLIADFDSYDIEIENILKKSILPNWKVLKMKGKFHKTIAIQEAAESIEDSNSIILQTDLHLEFPLNFIDDSRKHCVQGAMGYTPLLMRLACGRFQHKPAGFWEAFGYGIFGLYKSDWDSFEGMNVEKFRNAWGGEDWDFAERVIKAGLEIERLRVPYLFHYFHTKKGMWDGKA